MIKVIHVKSKKEMGEVAAEYYRKQLLAKPDSVFAFATGDTPIPLYQKLVALCRAGDADFSRAKTVNLDEYAGLDVKNVNSYRAFMDRNLFDGINIKKENTHLPDGMRADRAAACREYNDLLEAIGTRDIQLLGIGHNGHIGFNEPADALSPVTFEVTLTESTIRANSRFFANEDEVPKSAMTMGMAQILDANLILLLVSGTAKHDILQQAIYGPITTQNPASFVQLHKNVVVIDATDNDD